MKSTFRIESIDEKFAHLWGLDDKVMSSVNTATFMKACVKGDYKLKKTQLQDHIIIIEYGRSPSYGSESSILATRCEAHVGDYCDRARNYNYCGRAGNYNYYGSDKNYNHFVIM